jgi:steroid delta-isomerase-like uncharacterized protein
MNTNPNSTVVNKAAVARFHDAVNTRDLERIARTIDDLVDPAAVIRTPVPTDATAPEAMKQLWAMLLQAFPDLHVNVEDVIAEGDQVAVRNTVTGTNLGDYQGRPPTGKPVTYDEMFVLRFVDGRIAETSGVVDVLSQLRQLGVVPA